MSNDSALSYTLPYTCKRTHGRTQQLTSMEWIAKTTSQHTMPYHTYTMPYHTYIYTDTSHFTYTERLEWVCTHRRANKTDSSYTQLLLFKFWLFAGEVLIYAKLTNNQPNYQTTPSCENKSLISSDLLCVQWCFFLLLLFILIIICKWINLTWNNTFEIIVFGWNWTATKNWQCTTKSCLISPLILFRRG